MGHASAGVQSLLGNSPGDGRAELRQSDRPCAVSSMPSHRHRARLVLASSPARCSVHARACLCPRRPPLQTRPVLARPPRRRRPRGRPHGGYTLDDRAVAGSGNGSHGVAPDDGRSDLELGPRHHDRRGHPRPGRFQTAVESVVAASPTPVPWLGAAVPGPDAVLLLLLLLPVVVPPRVATVEQEGPGDPRRVSPRGEGM